MSAGTFDVAPYVAIHYGPDGLRSSEVVNNGPTSQRFGYDLVGLGGAAEKVSDYTGTVLANQYLFSVGVDVPLEMYNGTTFFLYHRDALGSITSITDYTGTVDGSYSYDPWGNLLQSADTMSNLLRYTASPYDPTLGLVYDRARWYDPSTGRFLTPDPMGGGYAYAGDNPVNNVDPSGMSTCVRYCGRQGSWDGTTDPTFVRCSRYCGHNGAGGGDGSTLVDQGISDPGEGSTDQHFSWGRCGLPLAVYLLVMAAMIIGWDVNPAGSVFLLGATTLSDTFNTYAPDIQELGANRDNPAAYALSVMQFMLDTMFFIWGSIVAPNLNLWTTFLFGVNMASDVAPGVLFVKVGIAIASAVVGAIAIANENCWPGM